MRHNPFLFSLTLWQPRCWSQLHPFASVGLRLWGRSRDAGCTQLQHRQPCWNMQRLKETEMVCVNKVSTVFVYALAQQEWTKGVPVSSGASWISVPITFPVNSDQFHIKEGELQCHLSLVAWLCTFGAHFDVRPLLFLLRQHQRLFGICDAHTVISHTHSVNFVFVVFFLTAFAVIPFMHSVWMNINSGRFTDYL